jgi:Neuraminidase-like domain/PA14 domain
VRSIRQSFANIDTEFGTVAAATEEIARTRVSLVYGTEASDALFAFLNNTVVVDSPYNQVSPILINTITAADSAIAYDHLRHRLSHRGLVSVALAGTLKSLAGASVDFQTAVNELLSRSEAIKGLYFNRYPELKVPYDLAIAADKASRYEVFLSRLQPQLIRKRKAQQALQQLSAAAGVELSFAQSLLQPANALLPVHADGDKLKPALEDVLELEVSGLAAQFFFRDAATGAPDLSAVAVASLSYGKGGANSLPQPGTAISGLWTGQLEAPESGFYNFIVETDTDATVTLTLGGQVRTLTANGNIRRNLDTIELVAGNLYEIEVKAEKVKDSLNLTWETPKRGREFIASRWFYPKSIIEPFSKTYIRFLKTATLALALKLTSNEIAHFATRSSMQIAGDGWLNALPVSGNSASPSMLLKPLEVLLDFARIKAEIAADGESLLAVLQNPVAATQKPDSLLFAITRWSPSDVNDAVARFGGIIAGLADFALFSRAYDSLALTQVMGISAKALINAITNEPNGNTVRDLQAALCARYDPGSWRDLVRPINDEMRALQRDALVVYVLRQMREHPESAHIDSADKLFEYFLMDVQMEPCMQTSRIRNALSSIQLFIERCLMNLEPRVAPIAINAKQWVWMKRYRMWEANRKVFLYPENWLEPELRDDKSPFFKEIESELLQSDITEERAEIALLNYLSKLEEVAKLEPCGIHHIPRDESKRTDEINHVIARSPGAGRKYFYRRQEFGYWTPWEPIKLDIEDNPVIPVIWKDRLFLFWLRIIREVPIKGPGTTVLGPTGGGGKEKSLVEISLTDIKQNAQASLNVEPPKVRIRSLLCWSEFFNGKWQAVKTSDVNRPTDLGEFNLADFDRSRLWLAIGEASDKLRIEIQYGFNLGGKTWFHFYNTHSAPVSKEEDASTTSLPFFSFRWHSRPPFTLHNWNPFTNTDLPRTILTNSLPSTQVIGSRHVIPDPWVAPLFYSDSQNAFFVTTAQEPVWVSNFNKYGLGILKATTPKVKIPNLVLTTDVLFEPRPPIWQGAREVAFAEIVNPRHVEESMVRSGQISKAIGTASDVQFGDRQIGLTGAVKNSIVKD